MTAPKRTILPFRLTEGQFRKAEDEMEGRCRSCGATVPGLEGDAAAVRCPYCWREDAYGIESLLERGEIEIR